MEKFKHLVSEKKVFGAHKFVEDNLLNQAPIEEEEHDMICAGCVAYRKGVSLQEAKELIHKIFLETLNIRTIFPT